MEQEAQRAATFTRNTTGIETLTLEEITDLATMENLRPRTRQLLNKNGIEELFPSQQATFKLFVDGRELIVK
jgi:superfamily II DNA/RNA helicase